jgi:hypothetical protein
MFSKFLPKMTVNCTVGLKRDYQIQADSLQLYPYKGIYFPEKNYFNSDPLPVEWMEIFDKVEHNQFENII